MNRADPVIRKLGERLVEAFEAEERKREMDRTEEA